MKTEKTKVNLLSDEQEDRTSANGTALKLPKCYNGKMTFCAFGELYSVCIYVCERLICYRLLRSLSKGPVRILKFSPKTFNYCSGVFLVYRWSVTSDTANLGTRRRSQSTETETNYDIQGYMIREILPCGRLEIVY